MNFEYPVVIADIGGTNARFLLLETASSNAVMGSTLKLVDHATIEDAFNCVISQHFKVKPNTIVMALACPIVGDEFTLTNANWIVRPQSFLKEVGATSLFVMNDFAAQGLGAIAARDAELKQINGKSVIAGMPKVVIGPGTGLGIVIAVPNTNSDKKEIWSLIPGEGGHMDLGPITKREFEIWPYLRKQNNRMEAELAVSGQGLENIHQAIVKCDDLEKQYPKPLTAPEITRAYAQSSDETCREAISLMVSFLARVAADMAVLTIPKGGIYLSGGITKYVKDFILSETFKTEFENKEPFSHLMKEIPLFIMENKQPALYGLAKLVQVSEMFNLSNAMKRYTRN